jgi:hypothetical protein
MHKVFGMEFSKLYPVYISKVERKGRTKAELDAVICWLTGFNQVQLQRHLDHNITLSEFFSKANINQNASLITGVICGVRIEQIEDPLMQKIRYLDKLVDELAKGRSIEKILRS